MRQYYSVLYERKYFSNFVYLCWLMTLLWLTWHHSVALINLSKLSRNIGNIFFSLQAAVSSVVGKRGPTGEVIKYYSLLSLLNLWSQDKLFAPLLLTILTILTILHFAALLWRICSGLGWNTGGWTLSTVAGFIINLQQTSNIFLNENKTQQQKPFRSKRRSFLRQVEKE